MTPNKFRPASKVGDMVSEHPQNSALVNILNTNIALVELSKKHLANPVRLGLLLLQVFSGLSGGEKRGWFPRRCLRERGVKCAL